MGKAEVVAVDAGPGPRPGAVAQAVSNKLKQSRDKTLTVDFEINRMIKLPTRRF